MTLFFIIEFIIYIFFFINAVYILIFAIASKLKGKKYLEYKTDIQQKRIVILIPAYKEDNVIMDCVNSCINQDYQKENYDIVVISDKMTDETNEKLNFLSVLNHEVIFENSTKAKSLNYSLNQLLDYDYALILDADNIISENFLSELNLAFYNTDASIIQAHRKAQIGSASCRDRV